MSTSPPASAQPWIRRMVSRDDSTTHRPSTNLELLFDLTFVVAVAAIARELAHSLADGHYAHGLVGYVMVFFAIWWAWMNFTWFASAYDTDDVPYRLLTLLQMGGVLVLAAGVPNAFENTDFTAVTIGYVIMRVAMVGQWLRAASSDPGHRPTCLRYAAGISLVQAGWVARLALPDSLAVAGFVVLALGEVLVPAIAERPGMTTWHPEHIAERYGLFTIIVLGECVTQAAGAMENAYSDHGFSAKLAVTATGGLVLLFGLWWLYFVVPQGQRLRERRQLAFAWGYGHLLVFSSLAAVAAGLEVTLESLAGHGEAARVAISPVAVALTVAIPVAIYLVVHGGLCAALSPASEPPLPVVAIGAASCVAAALTAHWLPIAVTGLLVTLPVGLLVAHSVYSAHRNGELGRPEPVEEKPRGPRMMNPGPRGPVSSPSTFRPP